MTRKPRITCEEGGLSRDREGDKGGRKEEKIRVAVSESGGYVREEHRVWKVNKNR